MVGVQGMVKKVLVRSPSQAMEIGRIVEAPIHRQIGLYLFKHLGDLRHTVIDRYSRHRPTPICDHVHLVSPIGESATQTKGKILCTAACKLEYACAQENPHLSIAPDYSLIEKTKQVYGTL
jgi:hypothetical protein